MLGKGHRGASTWKMASRSSRNSRPGTDTFSLEERAIFSHSVFSRSSGFYDPDASAPSPNDAGKPNRNRYENGWRVAGGLPGLGCFIPFSFLDREQWFLISVYCSPKKNEKGPFSVDARSHRGPMPIPEGSSLSAVDSGAAPTPTSRKPNMYAERVRLANQIESIQKGYESETLNVLGRE